MKGRICLFIDGKLFDVREYEKRWRRKEMMQYLEKLYALKTKDYYWEILPPVVDNITHCSHDEIELIKKLKQLP